MRVTGFHAEVNGQRPTDPRVVFRPRMFRLHACPRMDPFPVGVRLLVNRPYNRGYCTDFGIDHDKLRNKYYQFTQIRVTMHETCRNGQ